MELIACLWGREPVLVKKQGNEFRLTGRSAEEAFEGGGVPSGALAPALEAAFVIGAAHQIEGKVAHNRHVLGPVALAQA